MKTPRFPAASFLLNQPIAADTFMAQRFQPDPAGPGIWASLIMEGLTPRRNHGAATAMRGVQSRVFIVGGEDKSGNVIRSVEESTAQAGTPVLTPHTPRSRRAGPERQSRCQPRFALLANFATVTATASGNVRFTPALDKSEGYFRFR